MDPTPVKGDFSRVTFRPHKHYSAVLQQQGRVSLDADFNEHVEIDRYRLRRLARDVIGRCGGPLEGAGFEIRLDQDGRLIVTAGRYYVDGMLLENEADTPLDGLPTPGRYLCYLEAWERTVTAADDPDLLEPALGGADTSTRLQVVWQVVLTPADRDECDDDPPDTRPSLRVRTPAGGYSGLENRLYRVEIESVDDDARVTFKWSRDNGSGWHGKGDVPPTDEAWLPLEDGIEVSFVGSGYQPGDYWTIPARPAKPEIDWSEPEPAGRIEHRCCPLALLELSPEGRWDVIEDRRRLFAPLAG